MNKLMFSLAIAAVMGAVSAQEMSAAAAVTAEGATVVAAAAAEGASAVVAISAEAAQDGGQEIVNLAADKSAEMAKAEEKAVTDDAAVSAEDVVSQKLAAVGLTEGYDPKRKAIIQIGVGQILIENPPADKNFMLAREGIALYAYNNAKADIIRAINTELSATERVMTMAEFGEDETAQKFAAKKAELEGKRDQIAQLLEEAKALSAEEAAAVKKVSVGERFESLMDAVIKKLDKDYDPAALKAKQTALSDETKARLQALRAECETLAKEYKQLEKEAEALKKDPALETASDVKMLSEMPLLGSSVLTQAETWNPEDKIYTVAMAVVWSPNLQAQAVKMITDDFKPMDTKGKYTVLEWKEQQEYSHMVGPRRFTDKDGKNYFVSFYAVDLNMPVVKQNAAKKLADAMAMKGVAFSLAGDLSTYREASQNLKVYEDDTKGAAAKLRDTVNASVTLNLAGSMRLVGQTVKHPLLGRKIYVSGYYIDPALAGEAKGYMTKLFQDAGLASAITQQKKAYTAGAKAMLERVRNRPVAPVHVPDPVIPNINKLPEVPKAPVLPTDAQIKKMTDQQKLAKQAELKAKQEELERRQKLIEEQQKAAAAARLQAVETAKKAEIARQERLMEERKQKMEELKIAIAQVLSKLYVGKDNEFDTNF